MAKIERYVGSFHILDTVRVEKETIEVPYGSREIKSLKVKRSRLTKAERRQTKRIRKELRDEYRVGGRITHG